MQSVYKRETLEIKERLDKISPTMCSAKWLWLSLHLPAGLTQSCYHPPTHKIPLDELEKDVSALHNTTKKKNARKMMLEGKRPPECNYCWKIEDQEGDNLSDRHYRSGERWAKNKLDDLVALPYDYNITPSYVEVNFNQACNFKCSYCSPHLSTAWEKEIKQHGPYKLHNGALHSDVENLSKAGYMPLKRQEDNPYVKAFWDWWPSLYKTLEQFRMTGGEPLIDPNTFKVLDYIIDKPNKNLELSLTTNACPPNQGVWNKFTNKVRRIQNIEWKVVCIHKRILLDNYIDCIIIDDKHYFISEDKDMITNPIVKDIFNGVKNIGPSPTTDIIKFVGIMTRNELIHKLGVDNFEEVKEMWTTYTIKSTFERFIVNRDFYRLQQLIDLGINTFKNISIEEANQLGFNFKDEEYWYNGDVMHVDSHYTFIYKVTAPAIEHFMLFVSLDSVGEQLEYSRFGADYSIILKNIKDFLKIDNGISVSLINTFNMFSIYKLQEYLEMINALREEFNTNRQKLWFDLPILEAPNWLCINNVGQAEKDIIANCIKYMKENLESHSNKFKGFKDYEVDKLQRNLDWIDKQALSEKSLNINKKQFYMYFSEYDRRRGTNLVKTFPQLEEYYNEGRELTEEKEKNSE